MERGSREVGALPVAIVAKNRTLVGAEDGGRGGIACVAEQGTGVLLEELIGRVDLAVAGEAELRRIGSAIQNSYGFSTKIAQSLVGVVVIFVFFDLGMWA